MIRLEVKLLEDEAKLPTVTHPGEDLGYDVYALEDTLLCYGNPKFVRTGIAARAFGYSGQPLGLLVRDRSSMAKEGVYTHGGVIDAGYTGEILINLSLNKGNEESARYIAQGDKVAQLIPVHVLTGDVQQVYVFDETSRGDKGFGSSGR